MNADFEDWLAKHGAQIHPSVSIRNDGLGGVGAFACADIEQNSSFMSITHSMVMSVYNILRDHAFTKALKISTLTLISNNYEDDRRVDIKIGISGGYNVELDGDDLLTVALCYYQSTPNSFWHAYCKSLPSYINSPMEYSKDELQIQLGGTGLDAVVSSRLKTMKHGYRRIRRALEGCEFTLSWSLYHWASMMKSSRSFVYITPDDPNYFTDVESSDKETFVQLLKQSPCMLPLLDILNHFPCSKITWLSTPKTLDFQSSQKINCGSQIFNNYGCKGNDELFIGYGFCLDDKAQELIDYVRIPIKANISDELCLVYLKYDLRELETLISHVSQILDHDMIKTFRHLYKLLHDKYQSLEFSMSKDSKETVLFKKTQRKILLRACKDLISRFESEYHSVQFPCDQTRSLLALPVHVTKPNNLYNFNRTGLFSNNSVPKGTIVGTITKNFIISEENDSEAIAALMNFLGECNFSTNEKQDEFLDRINYIKECYHSLTRNSIPFEAFVEILLTMDNFRYQLDNQCGYFVIPKPLNEIRIVSGIGNCAWKMNATSKEIDLITLKDISKGEELIVASQNGPVSTDVNLLNVACSDFVTDDELYEQYLFNK